MRGRLRVSSRGDTALWVCCGVVTKRFYALKVHVVLSDKMTHDYLACPAHTTMCAEQVCSDVTTAARFAARRADAAQQTAFDLNVATTTKGN